jgi:hypothetical protein
LQIQDKFSKAARSSRSDDDAASFQAINNPDCTLVKKNCLNAAPRIVHGKKGKKTMLERTAFFLMSRTAKTRNVLFCKRKIASK